MQNTNKVAKDLATALTLSLATITKDQKGVTIQSKSGSKFFIPFNSSTTNSSLGRGL